MKRLKMKQIKIYLNYYKSKKKRLKNKAKSRLHKDFMRYSNEIINDMKLMLKQMK